MKGSEIVAALKGTVSTTSLNTLNSEESARHNKLVPVLSICLLISQHTP